MGLGLNYRSDRKGGRLSILVGDYPGIESVGGAKIGRLLQCDKAAPICGGTTTPDSAGKGKLIVVQSKIIQFSPPLVTQYKYSAVALVNRPVSVPPSMQLLMSPCRGMGTKFVPFCCQKRGKSLSLSLSTSFRFFQCLVRRRCCNGLR